MTNKKFIPARPDKNHGETSTGSYTPGTSIHLAASQQRQDSLETYGYHLTKDDNVKVYVLENEDDIYQAGLGRFADQIRLDTAQIIQSPELSVTVVIIPAYTDLENPFDEDNVSNEEFRAIIQYANLLHEEGGHYLHTDQPTVQNCFEDLEDYVSEYPRPVQGMLLKLCKDIWNAMEDGAIEEAIRNERGSKAAQRLAVKNETFIARSAKDIDDEKKQNVTLESALHIASMDLAKYDTGALRRLLDSEDPSWQFKDEEHKDAFLGIYDELRYTVEESMVEGNPVARTYRIFEFLESVVDLLTSKFPDQDQQNHDVRDKLRENQQDDSQNQSGEAQQQQSQGLNENSKQEVAQQHANITQQTVEMQPDDDADGDTDSEDRSDDEMDADADAETGDSNQSQTGEESAAGDDRQGDADQSGDSGQAGDQSAESGASGDDSASGETNESGDSGQQSGTDGDQQGQNGSDGETARSGGDADSESSEETTPACPSCGASDVGRLVQDVDGMIAARVNAPFNIRASWVGNIEFVSNDEVCGFRVAPQGDVPKEKIEQNGYKVVDVGGKVEILEPRNRYGDTEPVKGFECNSCGNAWVPTIGGDSQ